MRLAARLLTLQSLVCPVWPPLIFSSFSLSLSLSSTVRCAAAAGLPPFSSLFALCFSAYSFLFLIFLFIFHLASLAYLDLRHLFLSRLPLSLFFFQSDPNLRSPPSVYINHTSLSFETSLPTSLLASATTSLSMLAFQQYNLVFATVAPARPPSPPIRPLDRFL